MLKPFDSEVVKAKIDIVGLILLVVSVGSLQFMLDEGQKLDWFASTEIIALLLTSIIGFAAFIIWELTEKNPIVDLKIFRHRGYTISVIATSITFGAFFGSIVLTPLWLQTNMGYTATMSGMAMAVHGMLAIIAAPIVAKLATKVDPRKLVFAGVMWLSIVTFIRSFGSMDMTFSQVAVPLLFQGVGMPFFFIPLSALALSSVAPNEIASAAGLMNFLRTLSGAFAASIVTSAWSDHAAVNRSELINSMQPHPEIPSTILNQMVDGQSIMLATNQLFLIVSLILMFAASVIWFAPKPEKMADLPVGH
jgi:DHA2 family multidrug resistance protein